MDLTRRFVFRGNAAALSGQIYRPKTIIVDMDGASSLGVSGGRSRAEIKGRSFGDIVRFASAMTLAEGIFDDEKIARAVTDHKGRQEDLSSTTTVTAETRELAVGQNPLFVAKRIRGTLVSRKADSHSGEPSIAPMKDTTIQGVEIGGRALEVRVNTSIFQKYDTRSKLLAAVDDPKFVRGYGQHFCAGATIDGQERKPSLISRDGVIYATIVEKIEWKGKPYPGAIIDGHTLKVPEFGTISFGELLIAGAERRLTMVRVELGSPIGGYVDAGDMASNGSFFP